MAKVGKQTSVYTAKNYRLYMNRKDWTMILIAGLIALIICSVIADNMFVSVESTVSGFFAIISAALWVGVFNSIQRICKEHATIASECRSGLHIRAYVASHAIFDLVPCLLQALVITVISFIFIRFPENGVILPFFIEFFITIFLVIYAADLLGMAVSSAVPNPNIAMTVMPFVLIIQLLLCGVIFPLSESLEWIALPTLSKWGINALGASANLNGGEVPCRMDLQITSMIHERGISEKMIDKLGYEDVMNNVDFPNYNGTIDNLLTCWLALIVIGLACVIISGIILKVKNRK